MDKAKQFAEMALKTCDEVIKNPIYRERGGWRLPSEFEEFAGVAGRGVYKTQADAYSILGRYAEAKQTMSELIDKIVMFADSPQGARYRQYFERNIYESLGQLYSIDEEQIKALEDAGKKQDALELAKKTLDTYQKSNDPKYAQLALMLQRRIEQMQGKTAIDTANN